MRIFKTLLWALAMIVGSAFCGIATDWINVPAIASWIVTVPFGFYCGTRIARVWHL